MMTVSVPDVQCVMRELTIIAAALSGSFILWSVSPEAEFLAGKYIWASWDVDELKEREEDFLGTPKYTLGLSGWP